MSTHPNTRKHGRFAPGTFGCHEALDRTSYLADAVDDLASHPAIMLNKEWRDLACEAASLLADLYQKIGAVHLERIPADEVATAFAQSQIEECNEMPERANG